MSIQNRFKSDYHIQSRREQEFKDRQLVNALRGDRNLNLKAQWEEKTDNKIKRNVMRNAVDDIKRRKATDLNARREKLADLL
jgi:hypothetical protein